MNAQIPLVIHSLALFLGETGEVEDDRDAFVDRAERQRARIISASRHVSVRMLSEDDDRALARECDELIFGAKDGDENPEI